MGVDPVNDHDPNLLQLWQYTIPSTTTSTFFSTILVVASSEADMEEKANEKRKSVMRNVTWLLAIFFENV